MSRREILGWRPMTSGQFSGAGTIRVARQIRDEIQQGRLPVPTAFIAPYGCGKTSIARYEARCLCCERFADSGEPCNDCVGCTSQNPAYNGERHTFRHFELDCSKFDRRRLDKFCTKMLHEEKVLLFFDELPNVPDKPALQVLHKFAEEFEGVLLTAVTGEGGKDELGRVVGAALADRFRVKQLYRARVPDIVKTLADQLPTWHINSDPETLRLLVLASSQSFRECLRVLASIEAEGQLTRTAIQEVLDLAPDWEEDYLDE